MRLVHKQAVHAEFFKSERVIFFVLAARAAGLLPAVFWPFQFLHETRGCCVRVLAA